MFDPTAFLWDGRYGYICCHTGIDYTSRTPRRVLYNPLRWQIGLGRGRPCPIVINHRGRAHVLVRNAIYHATFGPLRHRRKLRRHGLTA